MDKKSIIGIVLIFGILVVFSLLNQPSEEEKAAAQHRRDSIALVQAENAIIEQQRAQQEINNSTAVIATDSVGTIDQLQKKTDEFGAFGASAIGEEKFYTLENNLMKITFSNKGGRIFSVELKDYQTHDSLPLLLFDGPGTKFGLNFFAQNRSIQTEKLFLLLALKQPFHFYHYYV